MKKVLIIGAGRSSSSLIEHMLKESLQYNWEVTVADVDELTVRAKIGEHPKAVAVKFDITNVALLEYLVQQSDLVISMLPAKFHPEIARSCLKQRKNLLTASYVAPEMQALDERVREAGILFLNECGLDPGLDHMTAMRAISAIKAKGGELTLFKSYTGGLVAPESDNNPWHYKFTWNPRNVVLAGQGGAAKFVRNNKYKYIPYHKLFSRYENLHIRGYGDFEGYPNRNSLSYRSIYGLEKIPTMLRGTLRRPGFCGAWDVFVQLGVTDDTYIMDDTENMTYREFINSFLGYSEVDYVEDKLCTYVGIKKDSEIFNKLAWLGIFSDKKVGLKNVSPAAILQMILEEKWGLGRDDKDMVVMQHLIEYELEGKKWKMDSAIVSIGDDAVNTAMSKTVGWPLAIAARLILLGKIDSKGILLPTASSIYEPILDELEKLGIKFIEEEREVTKEKGSKAAVRR